MAHPLRARTLGSFAAALVAACLLWAAPAAGVDPDSQLIGCDQADTNVTIDASSHLDPSCTWTRGVEIVASDVVLDCQGAHIAAPDRRYGIYIHAPTDVALENITVRNCHVEGFLNNIHIEREGFRQLAPGVEYEDAFSNIVIEDSTSLDSRGVGIFVNGYVTDVTLRRLRVEGASSAGIYLETGSKDNVVEDNVIVNNGYGENGPSGQEFVIAGVPFWFWGTGREGLAIDGSRFNHIRNNHFEGNSAGGIFLYKNCGEFWMSRPNRWFDRRYGSDGNVIEGNTFEGGENGVWVGSRMAENTLPMECSDPAYFTDAINRIVLDYAPDTVVRGNEFHDVQWGVRVEDDRAVIEDNAFTGDDPAQQAVLVGTLFRTTRLGRPVDGTIVSGNHSSIAGNGNPYRWIHGHSATTFEDNQSLGRPVGFCEGVQPRRNQFIFVLGFELLTDPENPPTGGPPAFPPPAPLPPCPASCESGGSVAKAGITLRKLGTPPGDDTLLVKGEVTLPHPFAPALDPLATGVQVVLVDANGGRPLDVLVPGGAYDPLTRIGWKAAPNGLSWRYTNRRADAPGAITSVVVKDLSQRSPGLVQITVRGARGTYVVDPAALPLTGLLILDPPTAETGQCGLATFPGAPRTCRADGKSIVCR